MLTKIFLSAVFADESKIDQELLAPSTPLLAGLKSGALTSGLACRTPDGIGSGVLTGTSNRITMTNTADGITLSGSQNLATHSAPSFAQVKAPTFALRYSTFFGVLAMDAVEATGAWTFPNVSGNAFVTAGSQTVTGPKTRNAPQIFASVSNQLQ